MITISHQLYDSEGAPLSGSCNLFPRIYTLQKRIKGSHRPRSAKFSKAFLPTISLTLCVLFSPVLFLSRFTLMTATVAFGPTPLAFANSSVKLRDHLRLIAFHPLLVGSYGGLGRGVCHLSSFFVHFGWASGIPMILNVSFNPTQGHSFFELIKRPYQAVACGQPQMSSRLGRP